MVLILRWIFAGCGSRVSPCRRSPAKSSLKESRAENDRLLNSMIVPLLLAGLALILAYIGSRRQISKLQFLFVALFFAVGAIGVVFQDLTMRIAALVEWQRSDLLLYFFALFGVLIAAHFIFRFKETETKLVDIVRRMAILSPEEPAAGSIDLAGTEVVPPNAWIVIPAYRESPVVRGVVEELRGICSGIIVVDDGSGDDTGREALAGGATVLTHSVNLGQGAALRTGLDFALKRGAEYIFTFDADGQHSAESLLTLAETLRCTGADVVLGSRWLGSVEAMPPLRRIVLRIAVVFTCIHSGLNVSDTHNGLRLFTRAAALRLRISQPRMAHASEIPSGACKLHFAEAPVTVIHGILLRKGL